MSEEMISIYKQLNTNEKRNELSSLIIKLDQLIEQLIAQNKIDYNELKKVKNYDLNEQNIKSEDDMLLFFYDDIWKIKNKVLLLLVSDSQQ